MHDVKKFADKVKLLGENFRIPGLRDYANQLNEFEQSFDVEGVKKSLLVFPVIVKDLAGYTDGDR